ncbi:beta-N-acetylhexosaminidase [Paenibacillus kribbensis]|uniref:beta-N-acetylhexosaminidase n=1 Tax=Paenibacillus kribbensis TaxID=172713 RepID=UPI000837CD11|nr:beta-N-acetylhexosaminidase [Paenibacillus kribbensis]
MKQVWKGIVSTVLATVMLLDVTATVKGDSLLHCGQLVPDNSCPWPTQYEGTSPRPTTIPALREWTAASGSFQIGSNSRILIRPDDVLGLRSDAKTFGENLEAMTGTAARVVVTQADPEPGDVLLELRSMDNEIGDEGYNLTVGAYVKIKANTATGAFYGTRTLLQLLRQYPSVPAGEARDWPRYSERGLMIDIARNYYSYDWLAERVRDMAYLKLNYLHLHFTDDQGWSIQSDQNLHSSEFLTKKQIRSLVELAESYHITVVPEIDMPGHMGWALRSHPEFQLKDANGVVFPNKIDYSIPEARQFLFSLAEEYLSLFPGQYWHMGADEFLGEAEFDNFPQLEQYAKQTNGPLATAKDGIHGLINDINALVRAQGKTLRVWNDTLTLGYTVPIDKNVNVDWWTDLNTPIPSTNPMSPQELLLEGYNVQNSSFWPTYDYNDIHTPAPPSIKGMYEIWAVQRFHGFVYFDETASAAPFSDINPAEPRNLGSAVHFWNDGNENDYTETQTAASIFPRLRVMAQKTWESAPLVTTYAEFQPIIESVGSATYGQ